MDQIILNHISLPEDEGSNMRFYASSEGCIYAAYDGNMMLWGAGSTAVLYGNIYRVDMLIAAAFVKRPEGATTLTHIDGNQNNNKPSNLAWA